MRVACLKGSSSKFCTSVSLQKQVLTCVKRQSFSGEVFVYPLPELHALKRAGWNPGPLQMMKLLLLSISTLLPLAFLCFDGNMSMAPSL